MKAGPKRTTKRPPAVRRPRAYLTPAGHRILIGRSGPQNEQLTFGMSHPDDTWLHARGVGGAHVIVQWSPTLVQTGNGDARVIEMAARLAAYYSSARTAGHVEVDYAPRRQVRKIAGAGPGMVTYRGERTLRVAPVSLEELTRQGALRAPGA
jgi:predicted ribosome quality control (RQC) complex YloA/Tae2 family protein